jgi:hypothetical protein
VKRFLLRAAQVLLTVAVTVFLFRSLRISWADLAALDLSRWLPRPVPLIVSMVLVLAVFLYLVGLWARLAQHLGAGHLAFSIAVRVFFVANLGKYIPGKVWQVAGLGYLAAREGLVPSRALFAAGLNQAFSLCAGVALGALYLAFGTTVPRGAWVVALGSVVLVLGLVGSRQVHSGILRFLARRGRVDPAWTMTSPPRFALGWFALHVVAWVGYGLAFCLLWVSFRPLPGGVQVLMAMSAFPAAYILGYVAFFAPAGVGVREGALVALTAPLLGPADATALAVIARVWLTVLELLPLAWVAITPLSGARPAGPGGGGGGGDRG